MDQPFTPTSLPKITRTLIPSWSSIRQKRLSDDILSDLRPETILEALSTPSGRLKDSIEAATSNERAFGLRAALASRKIHEWVEELANWPWPKVGDSTGFDILPARRGNPPQPDGLLEKPATTDSSIKYEHLDSLLESQVSSFEKRIDEIHSEMENLDMDELKRQILDTHFSPRSSPSPSCSKTKRSNFLSSTPFVKMEDFTAIVTAMVLQTLPYLSKLLRLMEIWSIRLVVLRKVPALMVDMDDAEIALESGWNAIRALEDSTGFKDRLTSQGLSRESFNVIRYVLQDKVMSLGQEIDFMLDTLEGTQDMLPESWLERMEALEQGYGDWVVAADRKVREDEWAKSTIFCPEVDNTNFLEDTEAVEKKSQQETSDQEDKMSQVTADFNGPAGPKTKKEPEGGSQEKPRPSSAFNPLQTKTVDQVEYDALRRDFSKSEPQTCRLQKTDNSGLNILTFPRLTGSKKISSAIDENNNNLPQSSLNKNSIEEEIISDLTEQNIEFERMEETQNYPDDFFDVAIKNISKDTYNPKQSRALKDPTTDTEVSFGSNLAICKSQSERSVKLNSKNIVSLIGTSSNLELATMAPEVIDRGLPHEKSKCLNNILEAGISNVSAHQTEYASFDGAMGEKLTKIEQINFKGNHAPCLEIPHAVSSWVVDVAKQDEMVLEKNWSDKCNEIDLEEPIVSHFNHPSLFRHSPEAISFSNGFVRMGKLGYGQAIASIPATLPSMPNNPVTLRVNEDCMEPFVTKSANIEGDMILGSTRLPNLIEVNTPTKEICMLDRAFDYNSSSNDKLSKPSGDTCSKTLDLCPESPNHEPKKKVSANVVPPLVAKIDFHSIHDLEYSLDLPIDGRAVYTNNSAVISTISSNIEVDTLCNIETVDSAQILSQGPAGTYIVTPPQLILSISYRKIPLNSEDTNHNHLGQGTNASLAPCFKISTTTEFVGENYSLKPPRIMELSNSKNCDLLTNKMSPVYEETHFNSPSMSTTDGVCLIGDNKLDEKHQPSAREKNMPVIDKSLERSLLPHQQSISSSVPTFSTDITKNTLYSLVTPPHFENPDIKITNEAGGPSPIISHINNEESSSYDTTPPDSPLLRTLRPRAVSLGQDLPETVTPQEAPIFGNVDISSSAKSTPTNIKNGNTDEQIQQHISSLLESISARISLSSESESTMHPKKARESLTSSTRPASSLSNHGASSRASTPSFTLAPAYGKATSRPRRQHSPEIRVYHLSCSTSEAPIKLFVRLVGENAERVMVRVGGGWADLGEYLREYASHHGRRAVTDTVMIQDAPSRAVSGNLIAPGATTRANPRTNPLQKPQMCLEQRPRGGLNIRKGRKSFSTNLTDNFALKPSLSTFRSPSTPLPVIKHSSCDTPPSGASSNGTVASMTSGRSSRMSWIEEDFNLGLAGPRGKNNTISDHDHEWVESMKEKVRLASAEKDRRNRERADRAERLEREKGRGHCFGELDKVGGTKRLFRREGSII